MRLAQLQEQLQAAILDPDPAAIEGGLRIHHSHFWSRMRDFVVTRHPLLARFLGEPEVVEVTRRFIAAHPPDTCVPGLVSARLARFLATAEPWRRQPIIAELAAYDFLRSGAALAAEEGTVSRAELTPDLTIRLKKRTALAITRYRFHATPLAGLMRTAPLDDEPTYLLVHTPNRRPVAGEIDRSTYLAFERLVAGGTVRALCEALGDGFIVRCADAGLLVGDA
jgi:hypothetical protein